MPKIDLYNENCLFSMRKMISNKERVQLLLTDIPYGKVTKNGEDRARYDGQLRSIDMGNADIETFDVKDFLSKASAIADSIYIFCGLEQLEAIYTYFNNEKDFMVSKCIWHKTNPAPSNGQHKWLNSFEFAVFAKRRGTKFNQNCKSSVWTYPIEVRRDVPKEKRHPTEKPTKLFKYLIESSSDVGDTVIDTCMGSGTTGVVCKEIGRNFIGIELNENYFNIAKDRISKAKKDSVNLFNLESEVK